MNKLKQLRKEKGLTQSDLGKYVGVTKRTIIAWENEERQIKPEKAQILADYFGVPIGYLLGYDEISDPFLNEIASDLNKQLTTDEKEHWEKHPELNEYYLGIAWDRMLQNINFSNVHHKISNNFSSTHYEPNNNFSNIHYEPVEIKKLKNSLSDEEIKALPKDEQKEYIQHSVGEIKKEIRDLNKKMNEFKLAFQNTSFDLTNQMSELTSDLIRMLADIEQMKTNANSRSTQEKDDL